MKMDKLITQRFEELAEKASSISEARQYAFTNDRNKQYFKIEPSDFKQWATSVLNLLQHTFGEDSIHYQNFHQDYKAFSEWESEFEDCRGIFQAAKEDYEGGYLFNVRALVKAEVLADDVLEQATELLGAGYKDPACVLAGVALESTLKELCTREGIPHGKVDRMNVELCKAGVYNMAKQKQITAWADLRNKAAHGDWGEYTDSDVDFFIKGVIDFMADYL